MEDKNRANLTRSIEDDFYGTNSKQQKNVDENTVEALLETIKKDPLLQQKFLNALLARKD